MKVVYDEDKAKRNKREVSLKRLDDMSFVVIYYDENVETGSSSCTSDSTNSLEIALKRVEEFLEVGVPLEPTSRCKLYHSCLVPY